MNCNNVKKSVRFPDRNFSRGELKDLGLLTRFTSIYCEDKHTSEKIPLEPPAAQFAGLSLEKFPLCAECREHLEYFFSAAYIVLSTQNLPANIAKYIVTNPVIGKKSVKLCVIPDYV